jgi:acetyltransferase-like isoleucine patch superfamily enzyme
VIIRGVKNISTGGPLSIGMGFVGFMHRYDRTYLNVRGKLHFPGKYSIGKGCRFDIGSRAVVSFDVGQITAGSTFIIMHGLQVGKDCTISWGCHFLDEDFHEIEFEGRIRKDNRIVIGDKVWIGGNVTVLKGSRIPNGCVVAAGSVVTKAFDKENCLIGGNPAKVIKEDVSWK